VQTHDRTGVTLVDVELIQTSFRPSAVVPVGLVNVAFLCTNQESRRFVVWEIECSDCYLPGFVVTSVDEFQGFLSRRQKSRQMKEPDVVEHT